MSKRKKIKEYVVTDIYPEGCKSVNGLAVGDKFTLDLSEPKRAHVWVVECYRPACKLWVQFKQMQRRIDGYRRPRCTLDTETVVQSAYPIPLAYITRADARIGMQKLKYEHQDIKFRVRKYERV